MSIETSDFDLPDIIEDDAPKKPSRRKPATRRKPTTSAATLDSASIRRVATKLREIEAAPEHHRHILGTLVGVSSGDAIDLTVGVLSGKSDPKVATDLLTIAETDPVEAGISVMAMDKAQVRAIWAFAAGLQIVPEGQPTSEAKAALALVRAVAEMTEDQRANLASAYALAQRS